MPIGYTPEPTNIFDKAFRRLQVKLSTYSKGTELVPEKEALEGFKRSQRLAYDAAKHVGKRLQTGVTEIEAANMLGDYLERHGASRYLHRPFAWFGNHTRFDEYKAYDDYHPGPRALKKSDIIILDVSPILEGYIGDIGYTFSMEDNPELTAAKQFLLELRAVIPELFMSSMAPNDIWLDIDQRIANAGYDNIHSKYPFCTLGHRVFRIKQKTGKWKYVIDTQYVSLGITEDVCLPFYSNSNALLVKFLVHEQTTDTDSMQ